MITRQHDETTIPELVGKRCVELIGVPAKGRNEILFGFLRTPQEWHRFGLDAWILFWRSDSPPDPADDLADDRGYWDIAKRAGVAGRKLRRIEMSRNILQIQFEGGTSIVFEGNQAGDPVSHVKILEERKTVKPLRSRKIRRQLK